MSLSTRVLVGLGLGIATGLFFGEGAGVVAPVGQAFILLLQMTVLPYVVLSLVTGLGSLSFDHARSLGLRALGFLLVLWGLALTVVLVLPLAYPAWESASFFSSNLIEEPEPFDFLRLYIPANPFESLADTVVPAVVLFSVAIGLSLIGVERKQGLLAGLSALLGAVSRAADFVVQLAPFGVFAIAAQAAGTMQPDEFAGLQVYAATYIAAALILTFWGVPMLVSALTPLRYREILGHTRDVLVTAFATGNVFIVLPVLAERSKELLSRLTEQRAEGEHAVEVVVPAAFSFPSAGKLLGLSFVLFAGWLSGFEVSAAQYPSFAPTGLVTLFGSTFVAIPFLLDFFRIPADTFSLFVIADNIVGSRFGSMLAATHILALGLLTACATLGLVRVRWRGLARWAAVFLVLTGIALAGIRLGFEAKGSPYHSYELFVERPPLFEPVKHRVREAPPETLPPEPPGSTLERIRARGLLRAGYLPDRLPHVFRNAEGEIVGFDAEMAYALARELGVELELVRIQPDSAPRLLAAGYLDYVASGIAVTPARSRQLTFSAPYMDETLAFIVRDYRRHEFGSRDAVKSHDSLRIAVPPIPYYVDKLRAYLPQAELVEVGSVREFFRQESEAYDALLLTAESGASWCLIYPAYAVAVPHPDVLAAPLAYAVARGDREMADFLSLWLDLKKKDGTLQRLFDYWVVGKQPAGRREPRWSFLRDVLGWGG